MIPIIYEPTERAYTSNGLGRLQDCINFEVVEGRNEVYTASFDYPINGRNYDKIQLGRTIGVTHDDSGDIQPFDIVSVSRPINGIVTFKCVHISYRLNRIVTSLRLSGNIQGVFSYLNTRGWGFNFSTDKEGSGNATAVDSSYPIAVRQMLGGMEGSLLDTYGGEYEFDRFDVKLLKARGERKNFAIRYGLNMSDFNEDIDYSESYTKVVPYWIGSAGDNDQAIVVGDEVDSGQPSFNGLESCVPLDLSEKFETKPTKARLQSAALSYIAAHQPYLPKQNITVDFVRLQDSPEYAQFKSLLSCRLCDSVEVIFPRYGVHGYFKIVKVSWDPLKERYNYMELGDLRTSLSDALGISQALSESARVELVRERHQVITSGDITVTGGNYVERTLPVSKTGYLPLGVVGHAFSGTNRTFMGEGCKSRIANVDEGSCDVDIVIRNYGGSSTSWSGGLYIDILWMKI